MLEFEVKLGIDGGGISSVFKGISSVSRKKNNNKGIVSFRFQGKFSY
jgi:hypothetical protein